MRLNSWKHWLRLGRLGWILLGLCLLSACAPQETIIIPTLLILPSATAVSATFPPPLPSPEPTTVQPSTSTPTPPPAGRYYAGDIHFHTWLTDGRETPAEIVERAANQYQLDYLAVSEHGGAFSRDPQGHFWLDETSPPLTLRGDPSTLEVTNPDGSVVQQPRIWRWQSLLQFSWPILFGGVDGYGASQPGLQNQYPAQVLIQGLEWNMPAHDHASLGIIRQPDGSAVSQFEYQFDELDLDTSLKDLKKQNQTHADALKAVRYLDERYGLDAYLVINHPSRKQAYSAADLRSFNDAAPNVVIGIEGFPGHQSAASRGEYAVDFGREKENNRARTYGGADWMLAEVGGVMDSLWAEGRRFWVFNNSDFHNAAAFDFWPGEYAKTHTFARGLTADQIVEGMRSGNVWISTGDLVNELNIQVENQGRQAGMGGQLDAAPNSNILVTIQFKSPPQNNHGDPLQVDHVDLIMGNLVPQAQPGSAAYLKETNDTTRVVRSFTAADWQNIDGWNTITFTYRSADSHYLRLRGSNLGANVPGQTQDGSPLNDSLMGSNNPDQAWDDLWFYSNPVFIRVP